jgi:hypothetical protein
LAPPPRTIKAHIVEFEGGDGWWVMIDGILALRALWGAGNGAGLEAGAARVIVYPLCLGVWLSKNRWQIANGYRV